MHRDLSLHHRRRRRRHFPRIDVVTLAATAFAANGIHVYFADRHKIPSRRRCRYYVPVGKATITIICSAMMGSSGSRNGRTQ